MNSLGSYTEFSFICSTCVYRISIQLDEYRDSSSKGVVISNRSVIFVNLEFPGFYNITCHRIPMFSVAAAIQDFDGVMKDQ